MIQTHPINQFIDPSEHVGDTIITASTRQRFAIREAHRLSNTPAPNVLSWDQWVKQIWEQFASDLMGGNAPRVLSSLEQKELWESVVTAWDESLEDGDRVVNSESIARLASIAFDNRLLYGIKEDESENIELKSMSVWTESIRKALKGIQGIVPSQQQSIVSKWIVNSRIPLTSITFYGFDYPNHNQKEVMDSLVNAGLANVAGLYGKNSSQVSVKSYQTKEDEIVACGDWIREKLKSDPSTKIGVIVPKLVSYSSDILRIFDATFIPSSMFRPLQNHQRPYRISLGTPIGERPLIKTLLTLLSLRPGMKLDFELLSSLIRNPYLGGAKAERVKRSKLEAALRKVGSMSLSWQFFTDFVSIEMVNGEENPNYCEDFASRWIRFSDFYEQHSKSSQSFQTISEYIRKVYEIWGLEERASQSVTDSEIERTLFDDESGWLQSFSLLDGVMSNVSLFQGLSKFRKLLREVNFQPASGETSITVLSEHEASNLPFDSIWVMGMTDEAWPKSPSPNPFITKEKQIEHGVPHASFSQEYKYAEIMTKSLVKQAQDVVFSFPMSEEGRSLEPSLLIPELDNNTTHESMAEPYLSYCQEMASNADIEIILDQTAPAFPENEKADGGTSLLRDQAHCPFKGFVNHRLGVKPLEEIEAGLTASMRGNVVHSCFDKFWRATKSHANLIKLIDEDSLHSVISETIDKALMYYQSRYPEIFTDAIVDVEHRRISPIMETWMEEYEATRAPFSEVITEEKRNIEINGLNLSIKLDHQDTNDDDGAINIADNKTGKISTSDWLLEDRLLEPQVPLYVLAEVQSESKISSVVFKGLKRGALGNKGIVTRDDVAIGVKPKPSENMDLIIQKWKMQTDDLATEFKTGVAAVSPYTKEKACMFCPNQSACRINEAGQFAPAKEEVDIAIDKVA